MENASSPWREPIVWLMVLLVGAVVVGSVIMYQVANADGPMDASPDKVSRTGDIQHSDLGPDATAAAAGLSAVVRIDREHGAIEVFPATGDFDHALRLRLALHHPTRASEDLTLELAPFEAGWRVAAKPALDHDWLLQLEPIPGPGWRLRGRLARGDLATRIQPAIQADAQVAPQ